MTTAVCGGAIQAASGRLLVCANQGLPLASPITDYRLLITDYRLLITDYRLLITDYRLPITDYRLPIFGAFGFASGPK
jgi:hypothetical protein